MEDLNNYVTGGTLTAAKFIQPMSEMQSVIENTGQALSAGDLNQLGKGIADYVANGDFNTDSGSANTYVLTKIGSKQSPTAYTDGMKVSFIAGNANTSASTVNHNSLGVKNIKLSGGADPAADDIKGRTELVYDLANDWFELVSPALLNQFTSSFVTNGYSILPDGRIEQWGYSSFVNTGATISFPIAFPNACFNVIATNRHQGTNDEVSVDAFTATTFAGYTDAGSTTNVYWRAIGY